MKWISITFFFLQFPILGKPHDIEELKRSYLDRATVLKLQKEYKSWKRSYGNQDDQMKKVVPIFSTNAHHHVLQFWLKKGEVKGPILHLDSHTDMGFAPSHFKSENRYYLSSEILKLDRKKISAFQGALTDISQVIIPALNANLSNDVHMCLPPWFSRISLSKYQGKKIPFGLKTYNKNQFMGDKVHRIYPVVKKDYQFKATPFFISKDEIPLEKTLELYSCFDNPNLNIKSNYFLSIDLDILSTNGDHHSHAKPVSHFRERGSLEISREEFSAFKRRLRKIMGVIRGLKEKGHRPLVITISDSTEIEGGGFTPVPLAFLAHRYLKRQLRELFPQNNTHL